MLQLFPLSVSVEREFTLLSTGASLTVPASWLPVQGAVDNAVGRTQEMSALMSCG